jgi:phosphoribosylformylglycinamidine (FGAM) synthase PurS component
VGEYLRIMLEVELLVSLKIPDVTALTAAGSLRRRLGFAQRLADLRRADYYRLEVDAETEKSALALITQLAQRTNHFVNPNKHMFTTRIAAPRLNPPKKKGGYEVEVVVTDAEGDRAGDLEQALASDPLAEGKIKAVHAGVLWTLTLKTDTAAEAIEAARDITVTRARDQGLLANPHFQAVRIG